MRIIGEFVAEKSIHSNIWKRVEQYMYIAIENFQLLSSWLRMAFEHEEENAENFLL